MDEIFNTIKNYKKEDICIITDFDDTLTKGVLENNKRGSNSFSVYINNSHLLSKEYIKETNELFEYYYDIEQDPNIDDKTKENHMVEWWKKEFELYKKYNLTQKTFDEIISKKLIELKDKVEDFFILTKENNIPTIIFSAGVYNLIHGFLKEINSDFDNIHVVSNIFEFDDNGDFLKTKGDVIHSLNKTFSELSHLYVYSQLKNKKLCILIGDSISDNKMVEGSNFEKVIRIGFLNTLENNEKYNLRLKGHQENFDLVISGKEDFSKVIEILNKIL